MKNTEEINKEIMDKCTGMSKVGVDLEHAFNSIPKVEDNNYVGVYGSINMDDLKNAIERLNKIPDYNDLLRENKIQKRIIDNALIIGNWKCKNSPIGVCIYYKEDEDNCLYCGEPYERK